MNKLNIKEKNTIFRIPNIVYVLALAFIVRLILSPFGTLRLDQGTFIAWSANLANNGFFGFYKGWCDYFPGYLYVLYLLGKIRDMGILPDTLLYKLPAMFFDLGTGYLIYNIVKKIKNESWGIISSLLFLFNPAILSNSSLWGQVDSITSFFSLLSLYLLPANYILSAVFLSIGVLVKPQAAFILPVIIFIFLKNRFKFSKMFSYAVISFLVFILGFVPFSDKINIFSFVFERVAASLNQYPYTSINAFNFWGLLGFWKPDLPVYQLLGYLIALVGFIFLAIKIKNNKNAWIILTVYMFMSSFLFFTRMHERHMLPVYAPLAIIASLDGFFLIPYLGLSLIYLINMYYSFQWISKDFLEVLTPSSIKVFILFGIAMFGVFITTIIKRDVVKRIIDSFKKLINKRGLKVTKEILFNKDFSDKTARIVLIFILTFALITRVYRLGIPEKDYFDEIYHAFTARLVLHADPKAWEWWNPHPTGFAYEWTHPPLSKLGMALSMKLIGENSFGWRFPQAIVGTISVLVLFFLAKEIFKDNKIALLSSFILSLDGLFLVLSRMGMNDTYLLLFSLLAIYLFLKNNDLLSSLSFGLALSSKWSAIWVLPILAVIFLRRNFTKGKFKLHFRPSYLWFLIIPLAIYLLSYFQMFTTGHGLDTWWGMQKQMWWYHTGLKATHPYTSMWYSWPFMVRPVYLYTSDEVGGVVSRIYAIGNPVVFWFGIISIFISSAYAFLERNKNLGLVIFSYLIFFVPWAMSPRIMFLYHYLPSIPFMCMASAYILRRHPKYATIFLTICIVSFLYFYPHWAGLPVPLWLDKSYYWFASWR